MGSRAQAPTRVAENLATIDVGEVARRRRLIRALQDPDTFEEFLDDPTEVTERFDVTLTEQEAAAAERARRIAFDWDRHLGAGRWLDAVNPPERRRRRATAEPLETAVVRALRDRIAADILDDVPEAFRRAADAFGAEALVRPREEPDALPPHVRPLRRVAREVARRVARELDRELDVVAAREAAAWREPAPVFRQAREEPHAAVNGEHRGDVHALRRHITGAALRAIEDAVERIPAAPARRPAAPEPLRIAADEG